MAVSVAQRTESATTTAGTSHTISFTQTTSDLVVIFFATNTAVTLSAVGDGFTNWTSVNNTFHVLHKVLDGSEGGNMVITSSASCKMAAIAYNVQGATGTSDLTISTVATGTSTGPNATSCAPSWGATYINALWITAFSQAGEEADDDTWVTGTPASYGNLSQKTSGITGTAGTNCSIGSADRVAAVASEDAGAFTTAQSLAWRAYTVAVRPVPTVATTGTVTPSTKESDIVAGAKTIILTLTDGQWIAAGAGSFGAQRQNIINGIDSAQSEATGWDAVVKATQGVAGVIRTSDSVCTITLDAFATYNITAQETITVSVPSTAVVNYASQIVQLNAFTVSVVTNASLSPGVGAITLSGLSPSVVIGTNVSASTGVLTVTGYAPTVVISANISTSTGTIAISGLSPGVAITSNMFPATGVVTIEGYVPTVSIGTSGIFPALGQITLTGYSPTVVGQVIISLFRLSSVKKVVVKPKTKVATSKYVKFGKAKRI